MTTWIDLAGWTLIHFVWQGALVAAAAAAALRLLGGASAQARYVCACGALAAMLAAPVVTAWTLAGDPAAGSTAAASSSPRAPLTQAATATPLGRDAPGRPSDPAPIVQNLPLAAGVTSFLPLVVTFWLAGVTVLLFRLAGGCQRVRHLHRRALAEPPSRWQATAARIAHRLHLRRAVFIVDSMRIDTPTVIGWLRPVVLLPVAAMSHLTAAQVDAILAHELAHIRRHDFVVNMLQTVGETLLFYHPAVWWISSRIRAEREHCCDDVAVEVSGDPVAYAAALTELAAWSLAPAPLAVAATGGPLLSRVRRLLGVPADGAPRSGTGMIVAGLALTLVLVVGSLQAISVEQAVDPGIPAASGDRSRPPDSAHVRVDRYAAAADWAASDPRDVKAWAVTLDSPSGRVPMIGFTGRSIIRLSYGLVDVRIVNAPVWLDTETFDLTAITASASDPDLVREGLRRLLEERLGLESHFEVRDFPVYALMKATPGRALGPNLRPSNSSCESGDVAGSSAGPQQNLGPQLREYSRKFCGVNDSLTGWKAEKVTIADFAAALSHRSPSTRGFRVVDRTGLSGVYDFTLSLGFLPIVELGARNPIFGAAIERLGFRSLFTALPEQLGLRLEESTAPFEVLVIDHIEKPAS